MPIIALLDIEGKPLKNKNGQPLFKHISFGQPFMSNNVKTLTNTERVTFPIYTGEPAIIEKFILYDDDVNFLLTGKLSTPCTVQKKAEMVFNVEAIQLTWS